jgi:hypothetical protein
MHTNRKFNNYIILIIEKHYFLLDTLKLIFRSIVFTKGQLFALKITKKHDHLFISAKYGVPIMVTLDQKITVC